MAIVAVVFIAVLIENNVRKPAWLFKLGSYYQSLMQSRFDNYVNSTLSDMELAEMLLGGYFKTEFFTDYNLLPLHLAVTAQRADLVTLFLKRGVDSNIKDYYGSIHLF